eukprot:6196968-Pleurochrysis_carterae.AAC.5
MRAHVVLVARAEVLALGGDDADVLPARRARASARARSHNRIKAVGAPVSSVRTTTRRRWRAHSVVLARPGQTYSVAGFKLTLMFRPNSCSKVSSSSSFCLDQPKRSCQVRAEPRSCHSSCLCRAVSGASCACMRACSACARRTSTRRRSAVGSRGGRARCDAARGSSGTCTRTPPRGAATAASCDSRRFGTAPPILQGHAGPLFTEASACQSIRLRRHRNLLLRGDFLAPGKGRSKLTRTA